MIAGTSSLRSFCNLSESERDLVMEIETKFYAQDVAKREPLLHLAVMAGNLAVVEVINKKQFNVPNLCTFCPFQFSIWQKSKN